LSASLDAARGRRAQYHTSSADASATAAPYHISAGVLSR